jgi:hypothetical protein
MTHQKGRAALPAWKADVLRALDIPTDNILWIEDGQPVRVESLVAAMPRLVNPKDIDRNITSTWEQSSDGLAPATQEQRTPEKIFISRHRQSHGHHE